MTANDTELDFILDETIAALSVFDEQKLYGLEYRIAELSGSSVLIRPVVERQLARKLSFLGSVLFQLSRVLNC